MATGRLEEIEEERRLFYVALTRAKDWLYVCYPAPLLHLSAHVQRRPRLRAAHPLPARKSTRRLFDEIQAAGITSRRRFRDGGSRMRSGTEQTVTTEDIRRRLKGLF